MPKIVTEKWLPTIGVAVALTASIVNIGWTFGVTNQKTESNAQAIITEKADRIRGEDEVKRSIQLLREEVRRMGERMDDKMDRLLARP